MKIIYVTDIHGDRAKYWHVFEAAKEKDVQAVVNGGDMLPKEGDLHLEQKEFVEGFLDKYFAEYQKANIHHLGYLGNDDLKIYDADFDRVCSKYSRAVNLAQTRFTLGSFELIGMNWVVDYPFQLKDRCRKDKKDYVFQRQFGPGLLSRENGFEEITNWFTYAGALPTIQEELGSLPKPKNPGQTIYVIHMPPARIGLDMCQSGETVGSESIHEFIKKIQPRLTLHGHIHESPSCSGVWKAKIGKTVCIQPGQMRSNGLSYVLIDLDKMTMERFEVPLDRGLAPDFSFSESKNRQHYLTAVKKGYAQNYEPLSRFMRDAIERSKRLSGS